MAEKYNDPLLRLQFAENNEFKIELQRRVDEFFRQTGLALAMENALKYEQAENFAVTDYLTGLPNARSLFLQLDRELARCKRDKTNLWRVMVTDMDGFKRINDRFGHLEGNRVLRLFAHSLKETSREYDYVARMGGDEFVVIAPGLTVEAAARKAEQMRELAQQAGREVCNEDILSLSVGKSVYPDDGLDAEASFRSRQANVSAEAKPAFAEQPPALSAGARPDYDRDRDRGPDADHARHYQQSERQRVLRRNQRAAACRNPRKTLILAGQHKGRHSE